MSGLSSLLWGLSSILKKTNFIKLHQNFIIPTAQQHGDDKLCLFVNASSEIIVF